MYQYVSYPTLSSLGSLLRSPVVGGDVVVGVVVGLALNRALLPDHLGVSVASCGRILRRRGGTAFLATGGHTRVVSGGLAADERGCALGERRAGGCTQRRGCEYLESRHGSWLCDCVAGPQSTLCVSNA